MGDSLGKRFRPGVVTLPSVVVNGFLYWFRTFVYELIVTKNPPAMRITRLLTLLENTVLVPAPEETYFFAADIPS